MYRGQYRGVKGRLFVYYKSFIVLLKNFIGYTCISCYWGGTTGVQRLQVRHHSCQRGVMAIRYRGIVMNGGAVISAREV